MTAALEGGEWSAARPGRTPGKEPVPNLKLNISTYNYCTEQLAPRPFILDGEVW